MADDRPLEAVESELTELCGHLNASTARYLALVAEFDARKGWAEWGCRSCAEWLAHQCGLSTTTARHQVRVANRLTELPLIRAAFEAGELSYSQVRALSRIATEATEEDLVSIARHATASDLEVMCRSYRSATRDERPGEDLGCYQDEDGTWVVYGRMSPDPGALFRKALEAGADEIYARTRGSAEPPSCAQRYALAAQHMADIYLEHGPAARSRGDRYLVVVHVDADELADGGSGELEGAELSPDATRRVCCDTSLMGMLHRGAGPPDLGHKTRTISTRLRRALEARDRHCRFPGCRMTRFTDGHHLTPWPKGRTDLDNLCLLCRFHHRLVHEGGFSVTTVGGELVFRRPDGDVIAPVAEPCLPRGPDLAARNRAAGVAVHEHTCTPLSGDPMDHDLAVHALLSTEKFGRGD